MQLKAVLAVIAASAISHTVAAPVANEASVENTLESRKTDAAEFAHQADMKLKAYNKFAKLLCQPYGSEYCGGPYPVLQPISGVNKNNFNDIFYNHDGSDHGSGVRLQGDTTTWNYGQTQLGIHNNGDIFYKDSLGQNCDVTHSGGPSGAGCDEYLQLLDGSNVFPGTVAQCLQFGLNCPP